MINHSAISRQRPERGSALILTVVLTSLLAIVGILFVMSSRLERMSSTATGQSKQLDMAVDAILDQLAEELVLDVPGVAGQEYYDAPDANDPWLSSAEPVFDGNDYYWRQVTSLQRHDTLFKIGFVEDREIIAHVDPNTGDILTDQKADADGDGLADTYWFKLEGFQSARGKPIYAAVRVVDHGRMFNVNTAYEEALTAGNAVDQPSPMQINIVGLFDTDANQLQMARTSARSLQAYLEDVVWHFGPYDAAHHPFDIQDELELRSRYLINNEDIFARIEAKDENDKGWGELYDTGFIRPQSSDLANWFRHAVYDANDTSAYDYRHITTAVSLDRVINPNGIKMLNVNKAASLTDLYEAIKSGLPPVAPDAERFGLAAQIAINVWDFQDADHEPGVIYLSDVERAAVAASIPNAYYGFEVHPYISEVAFQVDQDDPNHVTVDIELYNPSHDDLSLDHLSLQVYDPINDRVIHQMDLPQGDTLDSNDVFVFTMASVGPNAIEAGRLPVAIEKGVVSAYYDITLTRHVADVNLCLDLFQGHAWSDTNDVFSDPNQPTPAVWHCLARDTHGWQVAYQVYEYSTQHTPNLLNAGVTVSDRSPFTVLDPRDQWDPTLNRSRLKQIGQMGRMLSVGPRPDPNAVYATIGQHLTDPNQGVEQVFVNLADARFSNLFQYMTVLDPANYGLGQETRVKGRINVNTAPWTVLQGLPGLDSIPDPNRAPEKTMVRYRELFPNHAFQSVGDLMQVPDMVTLGHETAGLVNLEKRDEVFTHLADLATVRSDVFTAYIVVRMGTQGPQKRVLAVLDRSHVNDVEDNIRVLALQPVPESR
ncbi:MAG: helix-hairpin-helix domain-containing protein [Phycisphaerae bacterium]|nr:helix-hairpin-helix domain-containing protein [Phycisphaerae bacterium]